MLLAGVVALSGALIFSEYMFRSAHRKPYDFLTAWRYSAGFLQYMIGPWLVTLLLALCGYVVGRFLFGFLLKGLKFHDDLEEGMYATGTGMGIISIAIFLIGLTGILYPVLFGILFLLVLVLGYRHVLHLFRAVGRCVGDLKWDFLDGALLLLLGAFLLNTLFIPNNPSTGFDPINSHLCAPKYYLRDHAVAFFPWINFNNFPQLQEMLLTVEMMVYRDPGSSLMYFYTVITAVVTYLIGARYFGRTVGLIGAIFFANIGNAYDSAIRAFVEPLMGFYIVLMVHAFLSWYENRDGRWAVLIGITGGLACGVKYTSAVSVLVILILMAAAMFFPMPRADLALPGRENREPDNDWDDADRKKRGKRPVRRKENSKKPNAAARSSEITPLSPNESSTGEVIAEPVRFSLGKTLWIVFLWTVLIASPWYIRSIVLFGNPFFPFFDGLFGRLGLGTLDYMRDKLAVDHTKMLMYFHFQPTIGNLMKLPWHFTFHDNAPWLWRGSTGLAGPFMMALTPAVIFVRRWRRVGIVLIAYLLIYYSYWFLLEKMEDQRYMMSAYPLHCLVAAWALVEILRIEKFSVRNRTHVTVLLASIAIMFSFFYRCVMGIESGTSLAFLPETRRTYLANMVPAWDIVEWVNESVDKSNRGETYDGPQFTKDTRIYGLALENRRYYLDCPLIGGLFGYANHFELVDHASTGQDLYNWLKEYDCDYLMFNSSRSLRMAYALTVELPKDRTFDEHFEAIKVSGDIALYKLRP
jgi:hypothetical protein